MFRTRFMSVKNSIADLFLRVRNDERGETPILTIIGGILAIVILTPTMVFMTNFIGTTTQAAVNSQREKELRSWAIDEFETRPWNQVLAIFDDSQNQSLASVDQKFPYTIHYVIDEVDRSGGYIVRLTAPKAGVNDNQCTDARNVDRTLCVYYEYTKTPTLSESITPSWRGMNYGDADIQPVRGTSSPTLEITRNRTVNLGTFDGCAATTPARLRITFQFQSENGLRPTAIEHLVIGNSQFEVVPLSSASSSDNVWFAATINKPQPSLCFSAQRVRIIIDNGAIGTISDYYVAPLLSAEDLYDNSGDTPDTELPFIVTNPAFATDGISWYLNFRTPLTGAPVASYLVRGTGGNPACAPNTQSIPINNSNDGTMNLMLLGQFDDRADLVANVCDRYYIISVGENGQRSAEVSFLTNGITRVINIGEQSAELRPGQPTNVHFAIDENDDVVSLRWDNPTGVSVTNYRIVRSATAGCSAAGTTTNLPANYDDPERNLLEIGLLGTTLQDIQANACETYTITAIASGGIQGTPLVVNSAEIVTLNTVQSYGNTQGGGN